MVCLFMSIFIGQKILLVPSKKQRTTILFNNAIHPGEPDGITLV